MYALRWRFTQEPAMNQCDSQREETAQTCGLRLMDVNEDYSMLIIK